MGMGNLENVLKALRRRPALVRGALLRLDAAAPPGGLREAGELRRRLLQLLLEARGGDGDHAPRPHRPGRLVRTARCRPPTTRPARCCWTARRRASCARSPDAAADTALDAPPGRSSCALRRSAPRSTRAPRCARSPDAPALRVTGADDGGWTFRVSRRYASASQALAFQYVLDRLQVLNVIAWSRSARSIRVTAARDAKVLEPLLDRLGGKARDRRHPDARRAARRTARLRAGHRASASGTGSGSRTSTQARARRCDAPRRADLELPVAQGRPAGARRRPPRDPARPARASGARTSRWTRTGTPTTATRRRSATCWSDLDLRDATFVLHDWGGPIGLRRRGRAARARVARSC